MEIQYRGSSDSQVQIKVQHFLVAVVVSVFRPMEVMKVKHIGPPAHSCVILFLSIAIISSVALSSKDKGCILSVPFVIPDVNMTSLLFRFCQ